MRVARACRCYLPWTSRSTKGRAHGGSRAPRRWSRRPVAPHPPAFLTRAVQPKDLLTFGDQSAARGAGYAARGDWRRAFRSYVVGAEILRQLLAGDEPSQELRDRARRRLEVVLSIAEELKQAHPDLLLLSPSRRASEVAIARAWGGR